MVSAGLGPDNNWRATDLVTDTKGSTFHVPESEAYPREYSGEYRVQLLGRHQVTNALLAVAVGAEFGLPAEEIRVGLADCRPPRMRLQVWTAGEVCVLDDAYNANADSMLVALQTLKSTNVGLAKAQNEISTGLKIATAKENSSTWAIAATMNSDVGAYKKMSESLTAASETLGVARNAAEQMVDILKQVQAKVVEAKK